MLVESLSGIRGVYGRCLTDEVARRYAFSFSQLIKKKSKNPVIVIGADTRASSKILKDALIDGLSCDIIDIGTASTPETEFAVRYFRADGGIIITASHNEPQWNGFKFLDSDGAVLRNEAAGRLISDYRTIKNLSNIEFAKNFLSRSKLKVHEIIKRSIAKEYSKFVLRIIGKKNISKIKKAKLKVIIDPNGGAGIIAKDILKKAGIEVIALNTKEGVFKRKIEPDAESLSYLKKIIISKKADIAAGFDCDGDRMQAVTEEGVVSGHYLLAMAVDEILSGKKNTEKIIIATNDATSGIVRETAAEYCAKVDEVEVGEINVVDAMAANNSPIGGEGSSSGVIIPPSKCRDGILTLLLILAIIAKKNKPLNEIIKEFPKYYTLAEKIKYNPKNHDRIKKKIKDFYLKKGLKLQETGDIRGGLKVFIDADSFVWFRSSKTEGNIFRVIADSKSELKAKLILKEGTRILRKAF